MKKTQLETLEYLYMQNKRDPEMCHTTVRDVATHLYIHRSSAKSRLDGLVRAGVAFTPGVVGPGVAQHWGITKLGLKVVEKRRP